MIQISIPLPATPLATGRQDLVPAVDGCGFALFFAESAQTLPSTASKADPVDPAADADEAPNVMPYPETPAIWQHNLSFVAPTPAPVAQTDGLPAAPTEPPLPESAIPLSVHRPPPTAEAPLPATIPLHQRQVSQAALPAAEPHPQPECATAAVSQDPLLQAGPFAAAYPPSRPPTLAELAPDTDAPAPAPPGSTAPIVAAAPPPAAAAQPKTMPVLPPESRAEAESRAEPDSPPDALVDPSAPAPASLPIKTPSRHHESPAELAFQIKTETSMPQTSRQPMLPLQPTAAFPPPSYPDVQHFEAPSPVPLPPNPPQPPTSPSGQKHPEPLPDALSANPLRPGPPPLAASDVPPKHDAAPVVDAVQTAVPVLQWGIDAASRPDAFSPPPLAQIAVMPTDAAMLSDPTPRPLAPMLAKIARDTTTGAVELSLAPAELGRLHMAITHDGDQLRVTLTAERPETLDLLRRHADQLAQEFRQAGFSGSTLNFGQWGAGHHAPPQPAPEAVFSPAGAAPSFAVAAQPAVQSPVLGSPGLDLRL